MPSQPEQFDAPVPKTARAEKAHERFMCKYEALRKQAAKVSLTVLVWGPTPTKSSPAARKRKEILDELRRLGHNAVFPEELPRDTADALMASLPYDEFHQLLAADAVVAVIEDSDGAKAEIHDFANHPECAGKIFVLAPERYRGGYSAQSVLLELERSFGGVRWYAPSELETCQVMGAAIERVERKRRAEYLWRRYGIRVTP